jgi:hypothetical protein
MMATYRSSLMSYLHYGDATDVDCEVVLAEGRVAISVRLDVGYDVYEGDERGVGHYSVTLVGGGGGGTLHRMPGSDMLEGSWWQGRERGMWRFQLIEE